MPLYKIVFLFEVGISTNGNEDILHLIQRAREFVYAQALLDRNAFLKQTKLHTWEKAKENEQETK